MRAFSTRNVSVKQSLVTIASVAAYASSTSPLFLATKVSLRATISFLKLCIMTNMSRYATKLLLIIALVTLTQGFSWGPVFKSKDGKASARDEEASTYSSSESQKTYTPSVRNEVEGLKRPFEDKPVGLTEKERSFRTARIEEPRVLERNTRRSDEEHPAPAEEGLSLSRATEPLPMPGSSEEKTEHSSDIQAAQKEISEIKAPAGPNVPPERVEVVGVPREHEHHHITDGLADAIAGLMRVYNSLVRSDGHEWDSSVHPSVSRGTVTKEPVNETAEATPEDGTIRTASEPAASKGRLGALAVLAGIVVVATAGMVMVGFVHRERESPMYPPRGPAYV